MTNDCNNCVKIIDEYEKIQQYLNYRMGFNRLLFEISQQFNNLFSIEISSAVKRSLELTGRFLKVDRSYILLLDDEKNTVQQVYEWCAEGIPPLMDFYKDKPIRSFP